jgi:alkylation response protein AidB-like acyl-CoA dehydrogenase
MRTRAARDGDDYILNGTKTFITNGGVDDQTPGNAFVVYAATSERSISSFLVEGGMPGFRLGQKGATSSGCARRSRRSGSSMARTFVYDTARRQADRDRGRHARGPPQEPG